MLFDSRWIKVAGLILALLVLAAYGYMNYPGLTLPMCLDNPGEYDGREVSLGTETRVEEILPGGFRVRQWGRYIRVEGDPQDAEVGDFVQLLAVFHREGFLELKRLYVAKNQRKKILVSILPALLVLGLFFRKYNFTWTKKRFEERV